jgi:hypothetical protein
MTVFRVEPEQRTKKEGESNGEETSEEEFEEDPEETNDGEVTSLNSSLVRSASIPSRRFFFGE